MKLEVLHHPLSVRVQSNNGQASAQVFQHARVTNDSSYYGTGMMKRLSAFGLHVFSLHPRLCIDATLSFEKGMSSALAMDLGRFSVFFSPRK